MPRTVPSYTINSITASDFSQIVFRPHIDNTDPQNPVNTLIATGYYKVVGSDVNIKPDQKKEAVTIVLTPAQRTSLINFVNANLVPAANTQEGM